MNKTMTASVLASAMMMISTGAAFAAQSHGGEGKDQEKCYGVAKAGENGCAAAGHSCAGHATSDHSGQEWKMVAKGTCEKMGGKLAAFDGKGMMPAAKDEMKK